MERIIHDLVQGSDAWHQFRLEHDGASEAAAMLGLSKKTTRNELLRMKHTGIAKEFSDWVQANILDPGHIVEAMARPLVEELIDDELYPATCSFGRLSASCDGLTMESTVAFEHKQFNQVLFDAVKRGELPEEYQPQCQQIMMVTDAASVFFVCSDGTRENFAHIEVLPDPAWFKRIETGWAQFHRDLETYQPPEIIPAVVAAPVAAFPTLFVQAKGEVTATNMPEFKAQVTAMLDGLNMRPTTDEDFVNSKEIAKSLREGAKQTKALKEAMLAQTADIGEVAKEIDHLASLVNAAALALEKAVAAEEENRKVRLITRGQKALAEHIAALNTRLGKAYMPSIPADFSGALKSKRNLAGMENGIDTELARAKIEASAIADRIQANLSVAAQHDATLIPDLAAVCTKAPDDFAALVALRVGQRKEADEKRLAAEREKIRLEEEVKARATILPASANRSEPATQPLPQASQAPLAGAPAVVAAPDNGATMKLGEICNILGFTMTADFLARLGFQPASMEKNAKLYKQSQFPAICTALISHIMAARGSERKAA